jgi:hypothetical protein
MTTALSEDNAWKAQSCSSRTDRVIGAVASVATRKESDMAQNRPQKVGEYDRPIRTSRISAVFIALVVLLILIILTFVLF